MIVTIGVVVFICGFLGVLVYLTAPPRSYEEELQRATRRYHEEMERRSRNK